MTLKRFVTTTAIAAALVIPAATGFAQSPAANPSAPASPSPAASAPRAAAPATVPPATVAPTSSNQAARHMRDNEMRASKLIGSNVYDQADAKIGSVADLIVDRDGKVSDVVIGVGGFLGTGEKHVAVKMTDLKRGKDNHLVLNTTKDALKQMSTFDLNDTPARSGSSMPPR